MERTCPGCGKKLTEKNYAFCPWCGNDLVIPAAKEERTEEEKQADKWIQTALAETAYPRRREILQKGLKECPGNREILWELLFTGEAAGGRRIDFSVIKCHALDFYLEPENYREPQRDRMRGELFDAPELKACLALFEDPEEKQRAYLRRLCREYVTIFLEGNNRIMGSFFGLRNEKSRGKRLAKPVKKMLSRMGEDEKLLPEQRQMLREEMTRAFAAKAEGNTALLEEEE